MASYQLVVIVVFLTTLFERSVFAEVSFKNVTILSDFVNEHVFINSSTSLKNNLPNNSFDYILIIGKIPVLYENSVSDINSIKRLTFFVNEMQEIRPGAFRNLSNVTTIEITLSNLTTLQKGVFYNLSVEDLSFDGNFISSIEVGAFQNLPKLSSLRLGDNNLETIDEDVFKDLVNLTNLDLSSNLIAAFPKNVFQHMLHLKDLSLSHNKLEEIQEGAFANSSLENLDLSWNLLSRLTKKCFKNMSYLSRLDLSHNNLENMPEGVFNNLTLAVLDLDFNNISVIAPNAFDDMPNLVQIYLSHNKISKYNPDWFHNTKNIYHFLLNRNLIEEIPNDAFRNIYNNKHQLINLQGNKIKTIFPNAFRGFKKIGNLDLADNELETWNENFLQDTEAIHVLNLTSNRIKCVVGEFDKIFVANYTHLRRNPLDPECKESILSWASKNQNQVYID